ncbi:putative hydrolase of the HAD superfamily [Gracilibacillus halotolerans]|uniref:Putative hydrolase of the HAD superfamily n=1 Tax=Gracilibacillus halotolerans TaxID=74386 RepID=A0A841RTF1_9BACI|nr:HAD family hydrolase [Gracilibacillus halotolerans]MBB6513818.1 putative hydrolase of the HAD superfamily [Gracilibacillus halotolerans]
MIRAVIFDLDGTLLNRDASLRSYIDHQYERWLEVLSHIPKETYIARFLELDCHGYVWKDKVYRQLIDEFRINATWEELLSDYMEEFQHHCIPFSDLRQMLEQLKEQSIQLGMITNGKGTFQMNNIKALEIEEFFEVILVSELEGIKKPNPEIFNRALTSLNLSADECIFVGDHPINDIKAAKDVGMIGVWKRTMQWEEVESDYIIDDLMELFPIIKRLNERNIR